MIDFIVAVVITAVVDNNFGGLVAIAAVVFVQASVLVDIALTLTQTVFFIVER